MFISWGTPTDENYYTMNFKGKNPDSIHEMGVMILVFCLKTKALEKYVRQILISFTNIKLGPVLKKNFAASE